MKLSCASNVDQIFDLVSRAEMRETRIKTIQEWCCKFYQNLARRVPSSLLRVVLAEQNEVEV